MASTSGCHPNVLALEARSHASACGGGQGSLMPQYTLFRHKTRPELRCAVPAHNGLPKTLQEEMWEQDPDIFDAGSAPVGFEENAALYAIAVQGFYVFGQRTRAQAYAQRAAAAYTV